MNTRRFSAVIVALLIALSLAPAAVAQAPADPPRGQPEDGVPFGRVPEERGRSAEAPGRVDEAEPTDKLPGQPRDDVIEDVSVDPDDASIPLNLVPYHEIPGKLRDLQQSDRVSVEIIGESVQGRDLHLVVVTSPMSDADWDEWQRLSDLRTDDPAAAVAALEAGEYDDWKTPLFVNNNIHGNEWEGTDGSLQVLDELAFSDDPAVLEVLDRHVLAFVVTMNPDGRVAGTRQNANGFDMNRDFITASQPETRIVRDQLVRYSPITMLDQHGYVWSNATGATLIEPTTGPHGDNYEYDLYIAKALRNALAMEDRVLSDVGDDLAAFAAERSGFTWRGHVDIPYRNRTTGWDDWPPIFTPMYAMYHGTIGHTIEFPINPRGSSLTTEERHLRTALNTRVVVATIEANIDYATENRDDLLAAQLEWFRRGAAGEPTRPIDDDLALELAAGDNAKTHLIDFPRAYVIPAGEGQRSATAAARVVQFLIDNDVRVHRADTPFTLGGQRYAAGSYVVDMHQAKRGLANTILDVGRDVTDAYPTMYDISAWSHGHLWGATVVEIPDGDIDLRMRELDQAPSTASVAPGRRPQYGLEVDSVAGIQAVNLLLDQGVSLTRREDGTFVVPGSARAAAVEAAEAYGVAFTNLPPTSDDGQPFERIRIGTSAPSDEVFALSRMGFDPTAVSHTAFNEGTVSFDDFDAFYVSTTAFNPNDLNATQQAAFADWLEAGGTVVGRGANGVTFNDRAGLLEVSVSAGRNDANGIVAVNNDPDSPITGEALPSAFVSTPRYFPSVGDDVRVDQRLEEEGFFLAGHWVGQDNAAGHAVVVSGTARGANVTLFGTEPLYRAHPEGLYEQVAEALWWNGD